MELEEEELFPLDYDALDENLHPSLRDQEFLEHSSLWGSQLVSGGGGDGQLKLKPQGSMNKAEMKTDTTLPAYCNPPNPCPVGYTADMNCLEEFENTAAFSRKYQAAQDCMCDTEHMFYCPDLAADSGSDEIADGFDDLDFNRFLQRTLQVDPMFSHKSLVAKKYHPDKPIGNPFLTGEKLPVAAKKGNKVLY
ncbi:Neuroendocrine protein 7B2 precursor (Secretogranin V) [Popillia japonica]|uniref:Neuroendocrine protein 7B2 n=1 Tax=Popillia japonica TaxID=7064 RepID=A0AAW1I999_POPJA